MQSIPNLIIAGVHKAGTTSVFSYLSLHPDVCASRIKELGFFIPARYGMPVPPVQEYAAHFAHCSNARYVLEATPSYLYGAENTANAILKYCGKIKILLILREPVDRLFSFYKYSKANLRMDAHMTFEQFIDYSNTYEKGGIRKSENDDHNRQGIIEGFYIDFIKPWQEIFGSNLKVMFYDDLQSDTAAFMKELSDWLRIDFDLFPPGAFTIENKTVVVKNPRLHKIAVYLNSRFEKFWRSNLTLKRRLRSIYFSLMKAKEENQPPASEIMEELHRLYKPYNEKLGAYLRSAGYQKLPGWLNNSK